MVCACFYDENDNFRNKLWVLTSYDASRKEEVNTLKEYISSREDFCICSDDLFEKNKRCQVRLHCKDGFSIHISAGEEFYCSPRENHKDGAYQTVEGGLPNQCEELLLPYAEEPDLPTETVYAYVPIEIMDKVIQNHGWLLI